MTAMVEVFTLHPLVHGAKGNVLPNRRHKQLVVGVLKHQPDKVANRLEVLGLHRIFAHGEVTRLGLQNAVEVQQQRRFSGAIGPHQGDPFPSGDG